VKVFFTNLTFEGFTLRSQVKGINIEITLEIWKVVSTMKYAGVQVSKRNIGAVKNSNKVQYI